MAIPQVSAIICTYNRAHDLDGALRSLLDQQFSGRYEIIVVDNASNDRTAAVVQAWQVQAGNRVPIRYLYEATLGLSVARNTGAAAARAEILAYLDDDAIAHPTWLVSLWQVFQAHSAVAIAGGKVQLQWPDSMSPPPWLSAGLRSSLGAYDLGDRLQLIDCPGQTPRGVNYAIRRSFWQSVGGFDVQLGRVGGNLLSNEELYMTQLAIHAGQQVAYVPQALVLHKVSPNRLRIAWFFRRSWWQGISEYHRERQIGSRFRVQLQQGTDRLLRGLYHALRPHQDLAQRLDHVVYAYGQLGYLAIVLKEGLTQKVGHRLVRSVVS
ncbi:glycosyltransferase family 2 protein [Leptolyngbya sp. AN02str]|uniref:glycosyltransferase family 2 protein n=1 Tax=Leptolyngbya sp. AN02str TaxID=3423363 RepID=UPI003D31AC7B